jgi:hypothetical protein
MLKLIPDNIKHGDAMPQLVPEANFFLIEP